MTLVAGVTLANIKMCCCTSQTAELRAAVLQKDRSLTMVVQSSTRPQIIPGSPNDNGKIQHHLTDLHATLLGMLKSLLSFDRAC